MARILDFNMQSIIRFMLDKNIDEISSTYSGGGDSGDVDEINVPEGMNMDTEVIPFSNIRTIQYLDANMNLISINQELIGFSTLKAAVRSLTWGAVEDAGHSGWENGEGGFGSLFITSENGGRLSLSHSNYEDESETQPDETHDLTQTESGLEFIAVMKNHGITEVKVSGSIYEGGIEVDEFSSTPDVDDVAEQVIIDAMEQVRNELMINVDGDAYGNGEIIITSDGCAVFKHSIQEQVAREENGIEYDEILEIKPKFVP